MYAIDEDDSEHVGEATDNEEVLQAWCLLEESDNEQWQEVISRRDKQKLKKANQASLLTVEDSHNSNPEKILDVKERWVDSGAAGHVMHEAMIPRVNPARQNIAKKVCRSE